MALTEPKGRPLGSQRVVIERGPVRVFAQALLDPDPAYTAENAPVPPTFPFVMPYWGSLGEGGAAGLPIENLRLRLIAAWRERAVALKALSSHRVWSRSTRTSRKCSTGMAASSRRWRSGRVILSRKGKCLRLSTTFRSKLNS